MKGILPIVLILSYLVNPIKVISGTFSDTSADGWIVRFELKNSENEPIDGYFSVYVYDEYNFSAGYVYSYQPEVKLPNGHYTYSLSYSYFERVTGSFTVKDGDVVVTTVFSKIQFHFSGQGGIEKGLMMDIRMFDPYNTQNYIYTDSAGYSSINLSSGSYTYKAYARNSDVMVDSGQFEVVENLTQDIYKEITGFRAYEFMLRRSTGGVITTATVHVNDLDGNFVSGMDMNDKGIYKLYLPDNQAYTYSIYSRETSAQSEKKHFIVDEQNVSTTVVFYPVTFRLRDPDGSKIGKTAKFSFREYSISVDPFERNENSDPVFFFCQGHYPYWIFIDSSYPKISGAFDVASAPQVVNYIDPTHEVTFELRDADGAYLNGSVRIDKLNMEVSTWDEKKPFSIHLPDGEYEYWVWSSSSSKYAAGKLNIAGKDTTIIINHKRLIVNLLENNKEPLDLDAKIISEPDGRDVTLNKISPGVYHADLLNGNYRLIVSQKDAYSSRLIGDSPFFIQDADMTLNITFNQIRLNVKTSEGNIVNDARIIVRNERNDRIFDGDGEAVLYLPDGNYTYSITRKYIETTDTFQVSRRNREITLLAYPVTFKVRLSSQVPVVNYNIYFNNYYTQPDKKDEYNSQYLMLQGEYEYEVYTNSLQSHGISSKGKVKVNGSVEVPVTFFSVEASVKIDRKPATGSKFRLWKKEYQNDIMSLYVDEDGLIRDYVSNGLHYYVIEPTGRALNHSGSFFADNQNVNIKVDFYTVRFHIGQTSINYFISVKNTDSGEEIHLAPGGNDSIVSGHFTPGHYVYAVRYAYSDDGFLSKGGFIVDNQPIDIDERFLRHHFVVLNPDNKPLYGFIIHRKDQMLINTYINNLTEFSYVLPKGTYSYECYGSNLRITNDFKVENSGDTTYILFNNTDIPTIGDDGLKIYPNPANDVIWFDSPIDGEISIMGMDGKVVLYQTLHQQRNLDISQLKGGIYILRINNRRNQTSVIRKLLVN